MNLSSRSRFVSTEMPTKTTSFPYFAFNCLSSGTSATHCTQVVDQKTRTTGRPRNDARSTVLPLRPLVEHVGAGNPTLRQLISYRTRSASCPDAESGAAERDASNDFVAVAMSPCRRCARAMSSMTADVMVGLLVAAAIFESVVMTYPKSLRVLPSS